LAQYIAKAKALATNKCRPFEKKNEHSLLGGFGNQQSKMSIDYFPLPLYIHHFPLRKLRDNINNLTTHFVIKVVLLLELEYFFSGNMSPKESTEMM
jgi:hypothetical protein